MLSEVTYSNILYGGKEETYFLDEIPIRKTAPAGIGFSKARGSITSSSKISRALKALDLVEKGNINAAVNKDSCYVEVITHEKKAAAYYEADVNTATVQFFSSETDIDAETLGLMSVVYYSVNKIKEMTEYTKNILPWTSKSVNDCYRFCDAFYYRIAKNQTSFTLQKGAIPDGIDFSEFSYIGAFRDIQDTLPEMSVSIGSPRAVRRRDVAGNEALYDQIRNGEYVIPYEWNDEQKEKIMPLSYLDTYVPCDAFYSILRKMKRKSGKIIERLKKGGSVMDIIGNDYINLFLVGKPGSGKTVLAYAISAATGIPIYTIVFSKDTDEEEFEGKTRIVDGRAQFVETDFLKAYKNGGIVVLEEVNLANPAVVMGSLGQAVEFPFILKENGYKTINRNPMFFVMSTMNVGTNGSNGINQAFSNRHKQDYILDDPEKDTFIGILASKGYKKSDCSKVYKVYDKIVAYLKSSVVDRGDICDTLSIRTCLGCLDNMEDGDDFFTAVRNSIVGKIAESDLEIAKDIEDQVLAYLV